MTTQTAKRIKTVNAFRLTSGEFRQLLECKHRMSLSEGKVLSIRDVIRSLLREWADRNPEVLDEIRNEILEQNR